MWMNRCLLACACGLFLAIGCSEDEDPTGPVTVSSAPMAYVVDGGAITLYVDSAYCDGNALVIVRDTIAGSIDIGADSMTIVLRDSLFAGLTVLTNTRTYVRQGTGTDIEGTWQVVADAHTVVGMLPDTNQVGDWADDTLLVDRMLAAGELTVTFDTGAVTESFVGDLLQLMVPSLMAEVDDYTRITVDTLSDRTGVRITGGLTNETVQVTFDSDFNVHVSPVSDQSREGYTVWEKPTDCTYVAPWLASFFSENSSFSEEFISEQIVGSGLDQIVDMTVATIDHNQVQITGNLTSEVITVTYDGSSVVTYSSSSSDLHPDYTTSREHLSHPGWFAAFCQDNTP